MESCTNDICISQACNAELVLVTIEKVYAQMVPLDEKYHTHMVAAFGTELTYNYATYIAHKNATKSTRGPSRRHRFILPRVTKHFIMAVFRCFAIEVHEKAEHHPFHDAFSLLPEVAYDTSVQNKTSNYTLDGVLSLGAKTVTAVGKARGPSQELRVFTKFLDNACQHLAYWKFWKVPISEKHSSVLMTFLGFSGEMMEAVSVEYDILEKASAETRKSRQKPALKKAPAKPLVKVDPEVLAHSRSSGTEDDKVLIHDQDLDSEHSSQVDNSFAGSDVSEH